MTNRIISQSTLVKISTITAAALLSLMAIAFSLAYKVDVLGNATHLLNNREERCIHSSDYYIVRFSAYYDPAQQASGVDYLQRFCQTVPDTGPLIVVIDLMDKDVRAMPVKVKFVKLNDNRTKGTDTSTIHESAYKKPTTGFIKNKVRFLNAGNYAAYVEIGEKNSQDYDVVVIPFRISSA